MRRIWLVLALASIAIAALPALAEDISTDVTVDLDGTVAADEDVVEDTAGTATKIDVGTLPAAADLTGYSVLPGGDALFAIDVSASSEAPCWSSARTRSRYCAPSCPHGACQANCPGLPVRLAIVT